MEALKNEMNEAHRKIAEELTPKIDGLEGCSVQAREDAIAERVSLSKRIAEIEAELAGVESQELLFEEVTEVVEQVEPVLATVDGQPLETFTDYPALIRFEVELQNEAIHNTYKPIIADLRNKIILSNELELSLKQRNVELEKDYQVCAAENLELVQDNVKLTQDNHQLAIERDNAFTIRDNALTQIEELAQELENVKVELNRNRELKVQTETERSEQAEADRQKLLNSRIKIYNVTDKPEEYPSVTKVCKLAETGEDHEYHYFHKGRYLEITEDEALAIQEMNKPVEIPELEVQSEESFQSEDESLSELQQGTEQEDSGINESAVGENEQEAEAIAETWEQSVERRLGALEIKANKNEPEFFHEVA